MWRTLLLLVGLPLSAGFIGLCLGSLTDEDDNHTLAPWFGVGFAVIGFIVGVLLHISGAMARDGKTPLAQWYSSLRTPTGISCCDESDCAPTDARLRDGHWEVRPADSPWLTVPDEAVLKRENADGRPVVCIFGGKILCFVPPAAS